MTNTILTTKEVAKYLKLNEKTVLKMAQTGELPGVKLANQWRFYLSGVDEYLQDRIAKSPDYDFDRIVRTSDVMPLSRLIMPSCIQLNMGATDRDSTIYELSLIAEKAGVAVSIDKLIIQLAKRENMLSTAIGNGIAIPHPRNPSDELFKRPSIIIARSKRGVSFDAPDKKKINLFFMTCAPDVVLHLKLLSKVAGFLSAKDSKKKLMNAHSPKEVIKILLEHERAMLKPE